MDFAPCPRCQEMNPPNEAKCSACGASMDEEPIAVAPLEFVHEAEAEAGVEPERAETPPPAPPPACSASRAELPLESYGACPGC